ncbi:MAG: META domain-containing protein [Actinomycetia bacterium]|nr:META domain-containing protein [Actinomycetes bacterium]
MRLHPLATVGSIVAVVLLGAACAGDDPEPASETSAPPTTEPAAGLTGTSWLLTSWDGSNEAVADAALEFGADGELTGSTGCNRIGGRWEGADGELMVTLGPMTQAGCLDPVTSDQERAVVDGLGSAVAYEGGVDILRLLDDDGQVTLVYAPVTQDLAGTSWQATGINNGKGGVETNANTGLATIEFLDDGSVVGTGGCNSFSATWQTDGDMVTISEGAITEMSCGPELDAIDQQFMAALAAATTYTVSGSTLEMRDGSGALQVALTRQS